MSAKFKITYPNEGDDAGCPVLEINGDFDCSWQATAPRIPEDCMWLVRAMLQRAYDKGSEARAAEIRKALGTRY